MTTSLGDMTREFLDAITGFIPDDPGKKRYLCVARGIDPYFNSKSKYSHRDWKEEQFLWPAQADEAVAWIQRYGATCDVYVCPYLMKSKERKRGNAAWRQLVHSDIDGDADELKRKVRALGGFIVWSGTPGHGHVYIPLKYVITQPQHEMLCEGLRDYFGGAADNKIRDNDVLRPAGSFNLKLTVNGGQPMFVMAENGYNVAPVDPIELGRKLGKDITNTAAAAPAPSSADASAREVVDFSRYPSVVEALLKITADRSEDTYFVVSRCRESGLSLPETRWVVDTRTDLRIRLLGRTDDDVLTCWNRHAAATAWVGAPPAAGLGGGAPPPPPPPPPGAAAPPAPPSPGRFFSRGVGFRALDCALEVMAAVDCGYGFKRFYTYDGSVWLPGEDPINAEITRLLGNRFRPSHLANVHVIIQHMPTTARITDAPLSELINVPNGMLNWSTGQMLPHNRDYLSTVQLPVEYVPGADCPLFKKFLYEVLPRDLIDSGFIWELIGYCLYSGNPFHTAILLIGAGRNGKGTLIRVIRALLGTCNCASVDLYDLADDRFSAADLLGKLANLAGDLDARWMENTARFKKITGDDSIRAQEKYAKPFDFTPWALPFYSTNKAFGSADSSTGWMDRWTVVPFPNNFTGHEDRELTAKLTSEMELRGILAHAIAALPALMARGGFLKPQSLIEAKTEFMVASDSLRAWVDEECELDITAWMARKAIYLAYRKYAVAEGVSNPVGNREFYNRIGQMTGITHAGRNGVRGFSGIKLKGQSANVSP